MKKKLTIKGFHITQYISWGELERVMGRRQFKQYLKWSEGQTCYPEGAYVSDVNDFLTGRPPLD